MAKCRFKGCKRIPKRYFLLQSGMPITLCSKCGDSVIAQKWTEISKNDYLTYLLKEAL